MVAFLAMIGSSAYAAEYKIDQRLTSISALDGVLFAIVDETDAKAFCFGYGDNGWDMFYKSYTSGDAQSAKACYFKLTATSGGYYLQAYSFAGTLHEQSWAKGGYFNSQPATGESQGCCFDLGLNGAQNGQDMANGAVWTLEVNGEGKFALKNVGTGLYLSKNANSEDKVYAAGYSTPTYFTFCTLREKLSVADAAAALETAINEAKAIDQSAKMSTAALTGLQTAISTYESFSSTEADDYDAVIDAVKAATADANTSINSYKIIATGSIPNNSLAGWVCENTNTFHINTWSVEGNSDGSNMKTPFIENWVGKGSYLGAGKVYYKLEGLEPGEVYYVRALVRSYNEANSDAPNGPNFFINDKEVDMTTAGTTFTYNGMSGIYATMGDVATIGSDGTLTLGVEIASDRNYNWVAFKDVEIQELGAAYTAAVAKVESLNGNVPTAVYAKAQAVVAANSAVTLESINAINDAYDAAKVFVDPYATSKNLLAQATTLAASYPNLTSNVSTMTAALEAVDAVATINDYNNKMSAAIALFNEWLSTKAAAEAIAAVDNDNAAANTTFTDAIAAQEAVVQAVNDLSNATNVAAATAAVKAAIKTYVDAANPTSGNTFDVTILVTNPSFESNFTGWTQSGMQTQGNTSFGKAGNLYAEAWQPNGTKKVSQSLTEMPKGHYTLTVKVKARGITSAKVFAGSEEKEVTIADEENDYTVEFSCIGDVTIGAEGVGTGAGNSWFALDNFRLTYTEGLTEDETATIALKQAIDDAKAAADARPVGDALFAVPTAANTTLSDAIVAAQTVYDNAAATTAEKVAAASTLNDAVDTYKAVSINTPEAGKGYFLKQKTTSLYMNLTEAVTITAEPYAIQFIANGEGWTIASAANTEVTAGMAGGNTWSMSNNKVTAWKFNLKDATEGTYTIQGPNGLIGSDNTTAGSSCYGNKAEANNGLWIVEEAAEATIAVAAANEYATFVAPFDVTIPAGVKAYTVDGVTGTDLDMTEVTTTIPANTPVVLQATTDVNEKFYGIAATAEAKAGLLTGVYTDTPAPVGTYVLQNQGEVKFYLVEAGAQPTVKAGHAYLTAPSAGVKAFGFDAIATAIAGLTPTLSKGEGVVYNLQGQQLNSLQRGINIVGGKKVLVK